MSGNPGKKEKQQGGPGKKGQQKGQPQENKGGKGGGKNQAQASKGKQAEGSEDVKREQKLQAIILADSFSKTFRPVTLECPKVLLPLVNVPMLDYTIEFLSQNGVEEVFVFCVWHADKVEQYLKQSKWNDLLSIQCISSPGCCSAGDALREMDKLSIIRSDPFILISGDVISNLNLKKAIAYHKKKRSEDPNNIMTLVLKKVQKVAGVKPILDDLVVGINKYSSQLVFFDDSVHKQGIRIPLELMRYASDLNFSTEYLDCNVDICSPELILQFSDNFDYQDIRRDFIHNEVSNYSLGKHLYAYVINQEYAARVQDPRSYHSICRDLVTRWVYPLVPDNPLLGTGGYSHSQRYLYREQSNVRIDRGANIGEEVVIARDCEIHSSSSITRSTLDRGCVLHHHSLVTGSALWANVHISANATVTQSILCDDVSIGEGAVIERGCIISYGVKVPPNTIVPEFTRLTTVGASRISSEEYGITWTPDAASLLPAALLSLAHSQQGEQDDHEDGLMMTIDHGIDAKRAMKMGSIGCHEEQDWKRKLWSNVPLPPLEDDDEDDDSDFNGKDEGSDGLPAAGVEDISLEGSDDDDSTEHHHHHHQQASRANSNRSPLPPSSSSSGSGGDAFTKGVAELLAPLLQTPPAPADPRATAMEIKAFKFAQNKSFGDCCRAVTVALLKRHVDGAATLTAALKKLQAAIEDEAPVTEVLAELQQEIGDQLEMIDGIEDYVLGRGGDYAMSLAFFLRVFYDQELLDENAVLLWAANKEKFKVRIAGGAVTLNEEDKRRLALFDHSLMKKFLKDVEEGADEDEDEDKERENSGDESDD